MASTKIILLTMVKNESRIIERLFNSVKGKVDGIVMCDTGSTDNTIELAMKWYGENGVEGGVYEFPFVNFGKSRTKSFESCQEWVKEKGWDSSKTWALLLDGDMLMEDAVKKEDLERQGGHIAGVSLRQANGSLVYSNMRLLRCSEPWICKGATHEAWTCPGGKHVENFMNPVLRDHGDGGCKADKYPRDVRLLKQDLEEMPNDARTHFYLGQTYLCMRDWDNAIPVLKRRLEIGGWDEEDYITELYLGDCLKASGKAEEALVVWMKGWQKRQHRTETIMRVINHFRCEAKSQALAMVFLEKMFRIQRGEDLLTGEKYGPPANNNDKLFVNQRDVDYHMWEELLILSYYVGAGRATWLRVDELDLKNNLGWHDFNSLFAQIHWYDWVLKPRQKYRFAIPLEKLPWNKEPEGAIWQPFNPSIRLRADKSGYDINLRYANYYTLEAKHYAYRGFNGQVLTRNCKMFVPRGTGWNQGMNFDEIKIDPTAKQDEGSHIKGVEDCRLVVGSDRDEFLGTSKSYSDNGVNKIQYCWRDGDRGYWNIRQLALPAGVSPGECQKNWLGYRNEGGELEYIYSFSPFRICKENGEKIVEVDCGLKEYRGSAGPVRWTSKNVSSEAYICVMHKVYIGGEGRRYYHRFMTLDKDKKPSRVSCWVRMTKERVEYWSSMCENAEGDGYWITYGLKDSEAYIAEMTKDQIENFMMYSMKEDSMKEGVAFKERLERLKEY
jgi:glycosyltransferase involved in cell wall biosynthesis